MAARIDIYGGRDPADVPAYPPADVARLLALPPSTLRSWVFGRVYAKKSGGVGRFHAIIQPPNPHFLSFTNVVEAHVLASLRRSHAVDLGKIRSAVAYVREALGVPRPLAHERFKTDGVDLFVERMGKLLNASREGQVEMREVMAEYLKRVEYGTVGGGAVRFFPLYRSEAPPIVVVDPRRAFGRPIITGTSVPIDDIRDRWKNGDPMEALAADYDIPLAHIEEALRAARAA